MGLIFTDTFCGGDDATKWEHKSGGGPIVGVGFRTNGRGYYNASVAASLTKQVYSTEEHATMSAGVATKVPSGTGGRTTTSLVFNSDSVIVSGSIVSITRHVTVEVKPGNPGTIKVYRGTTAGTLLGTYTGVVMATANWYYIEAKVTLGDSGSVEVWLDGGSVLNLTGVDTKNGGTKAVLDSVTFEYGNTTDTVSLNDLYITNGAGSANTGLLGAPRILWIRPSGNGATSNGVGSDGDSVNNYLQVDDGPGSITGDSVDFANTGDKDTYAFQDTVSFGIPLTNLVRGVVVNAHADKTDMGARTMIAVARTGGGTEADAPAAPLVNGAFFPTRGAFDAKPGGGTWTLNDIETMEFGVKAGT